jgi:hypothetical protein
MRGGEEEEQRGSDKNNTNRIEGGRYIIQIG